MSEDNGQDRKDNESQDSVAKHLAEKRRALDLRTRPMEVIDDLDWDIPDFDDDDDDLSLSPDDDVSSATPAPSAADDSSSSERRKRASSGTMMMSASAFKDAMDEESPGEIELDDEPTESPSEASAEPAIATEDLEESASETAAETPAATTRSGTIMMSTGSMDFDKATTDDEQERHVEASREWHGEDLEEGAAHVPVDDEALTGDADDAGPGARGTGGTMLISGAALKDEIDAQREAGDSAVQAAETTPYSQLAAESEARHVSDPDNPTQAESSVESSHATAQAEAVAKRNEGLDDTDPYRRDIPRAKGQGLLYGAAIALAIGIVVLLFMLFFE